MTIRLISTCEPERLHLVPQFIRHYERQGVQDFILSLQFEPETDEAEVRVGRAMAAEIARELQIRPFHELYVHFDAMALRAHHDLLQDTECADKDWIVWADMDEFHWFGSHLLNLCDEFSFGNFNAIRGYFIDRIARDGELIEFDSSRPIWAQYPIGCDVTATIVRGMTKKVILARGDVRIRHANHDPLRHQRIDWAPIRAPIFHFKWESSVSNRLGARLTPHWKKRCPWWTQSASALEAITKNDGRIPLEHLKCFDFLDDKYPTEYFPYEKNSRYREQWLYWQSSLPDPSK